jgi:hypothetical protein
MFRTYYYLCPYKCNKVYIKKLVGNYNNLYNMDDIGGVKMQQSCISFFQSLIVFAK